MVKDFAFYNFEDSILMKVLCPSEVTVFNHDDLSQMLQKQFNITIYKKKEISDELKEELERVSNFVYKFEDFLGVGLTESEKEQYYYVKFCIEQSINLHTEEDKMEILKEANVKSFEELHKHFMVCKSANVHIVDTDLCFEENTAKYTRSLANVYDTTNWEDGDIVVVKKAIQKGKNKGKFVYNNNKIHSFDFTIDSEEGHMIDECPVVSQFPINYWASSFTVDNASYSLIDNNALVMCCLLPEAFKCFISHRCTFIKKYFNTEQSVVDITLDDRLIIVHNNGVNVGFICEYGMNVDPSQLRENLIKCNEIMTTGYDNSIYVQYPKYIQNIDVAGKYSLVKKETYIHNLEMNINADYNYMVKKLLEHDVAPNNICLIDCGEL